MRIESIELTNFKGITGKFQLSALHPAVGPNGSGKTALLKAIQWGTEGRRLAYVAITRAKEAFALHFRKPEDQAQDRKIKQPSRFLTESGVLA